MLKALINWYSRKVASFIPTPLQVMQDSLHDAEMEYLRTVQKQEYHACHAEMQAVAVKHEFKRCQRLQKFIDQETEAQSRSEDDQMDALLSSMSGLFDFIDRHEAQQQTEGPKEPTVMNERQLEEYLKSLSKKPQDDKTNKA